MLASGDLSDLNLVLNIFDSQVVQMATSGAFWDITPYIKDYKTLSAMPAVVWDNAKIKGKNYGVPRPRPLEGSWGVHVRKDWLDKLGMKVPETMDEMYAVLKAFTEKDPDGNGKADTLGSQVKLMLMAWACMVGLKMYLTTIMDSGNFQTIKLRSLLLSQRNVKHWNGSKKHMTRKYLRKISQ
jgi:ABC-type glycerol-3-phosphate transport system substrate-binding protein